MSRASGRASAWVKRPLEARELEPAGHAAELLGRELLRPRERVVHGREHEVLEGLDIRGVDRVLADLDLAGLLRPGHHDRDRAAAPASGDRELAELGLGLLHVGLHLTRHALQVTDVLHAHSTSRIRSGLRNVSSAARSIGSSVAGCVFVAAAAGCLTHRTRMAVPTSSPRSRSSSGRWRSHICRANSSLNASTIVPPSIATGSAFTSCAAFAMLRSCARSSSGSHADRTRCSVTPCDAAPTGPAVTALATGLPCWARRC